MINALWYNAELRLNALPKGRMRRIPLAEKVVYIYPYFFKEVQKCTFRVLYKKG